MLSLQAQLNNDSLNTTKDTTQNYTIEIDSTGKDSLQTGFSDELKSKVHYSANSLISFDVAEDKVYLFDNAIIEFENITLKAAFISINWDAKTLYASGLPDSSGKIAGLPVFKDGNDEFTSETMKYNFETKKGKIEQVRLQQGEGFIHGEQVKKDAEENYYLRNGYYTTCDLPHPHYMIHSNKIKAVQGRQIVTGPANLVIEDVPTPLFIPFGYFPFRKNRASGIIFPAYGESNSRGFFLSNGGYYFGISDYVDAELRGDIYTFGGYNVRVLSTYAKRYRFNGNLSLSYSFIKSGEKELNNLTKTKDYFIQWSHRQDAKAHPNSSFSASVNAGSTGYYSNNLSSANNYLSNTFSSSIAYSKVFPNSPFNLSVSANHSQNNISKIYNISLPVASVGMGTVYPFRKKNRIGNQKWYERIGTSYSGNFTNQIVAPDSILFTPEAKQYFRNGISHSVPISTSFKVLQYLTLSTSVNFRGYNYFSSIRKTYNPVDSTVTTDTISGLKSAVEYSLSAGLNTRLYGMMQFRKGKIAAIRHVITPNISFTYRPDFSKTNFPYYKTVQANAEGATTRYSVFETGIYGGPPSGKYGFLGFGIDNNLEMKYRAKSDSGVVQKKLKLLESFSISSGYNLAADSLQLSNFSVNARTTLFDKISLNMSSSFDPYIITEQNVRVNKFEWKEHNRLARLTNVTMSVSYSLTHANKNHESAKGTDAELKEINNRTEDYLDFEMPFNLSAGYSYSFTNNVNTADITAQTLNLNGDVNLTKKWKVTLYSGFDFVTKKRTYTSLGLFRDLHCWQMSLNWIPTGGQQSYFFQINVKSSILQDLKLVKKNDIYDR